MHRSVHWHEGMFLRPQHFQAADQYWSNRVQIGEQWDHPYNYGLRSLNILEESIANQQFQVDRCQARLPDGTLVDVVEGLDRVGLRGKLGPAGLAEALAEGARARVYLVLPKRKDNQANVERGADGASALRWSIVRQPMSDESRGGSEQTLELKDPNVGLRVVADEDLLAGYEYLPIAQIKRTGAESGAPQLDEEYIPPILSIDAWPRLGRGLLRQIFDKISTKVSAMASQVTVRGITFAPQEAGDLERLWMLMGLNEGKAVLEALLFSSGVHPFTAYVELCRLAGRLAVFGKERSAPDLPKYDHDNLWYVFDTLRALIYALLDSVREFEWDSEPFLGAGRGMQVRIKQNWLAKGWNWYVGVNHGSLPPNECRELLKPGKLNWKIGSASQIDNLFDKYLPGVLIEPLVQVPRNLPAGGNWLYYEVKRNEGDAFRSVIDTQTLAVRFKTELIGNLPSLSGQRNLVVQVANRQVVLQFMLFAVPPHD